jgi:MFS transporter, DHA1 family, multidrug resistance protein
MKKTAQPLTVPLLLALSLAGILGPFGTDVYLPAFPRMVSELGVSPATIQLTLTAFTVGMAVGQLVVGSLSDRYGRKPLMLIGALLVAASSAAGALASDATFLVVACGLIGLSSSAGIAVGRAVVADLTTGQQAARSFSLLGLIVGFGPILGPIAGAFAMVIFDGWRGIFWSFAAFAVLVFGALVFIPESLPPNSRHSGGVGVMIGSAGKVLANRSFVLFACTIWFGFGAMFAYISASSFIVQSVLKMSPLEYTYVFGAIGIGLMVTGFITTKLLKVWASSKIIMVGLAQLLVGALGLLLLVFTESTDPIAMITCLMLIGSCMGFVFGPASSLAVSQVRESAGTAMALLGSVQFIFAGVAAPLVGIAGKNAVWPFAWVCFIFSMLAIGAVALGRRHETKTKQE